MSNPGYLRCKPFNVVLLFLQYVLAHKHRKRAIPHSYTLDLLIEPSLNLFPYKVRRRLCRSSSSASLTLSKSSISRNFPCIPLKYNTLKHRSNPACRLLSAPADTSPRNHLPSQHRYLSGPLPQSSSSARWLCL